MNSVETTGKTVDEAISQALIKLGVPSDQVDIEILDEGSKGLLGLFGKNAHIRATLKQQAPEDEIYEELSQIRQSVQEEAPKKEAPKKEAVKKEEPVQAPVAQKVEEPVQEASE